MTCTWCDEHRPGGHCYGPDPNDDYGRCYLQLERERVDELESQAEIRADDARWEKEHG